MSLSDTFIRRPVLSTVCSILILMAGMIALPLLPIENLPNIAPPTIQVNANLPGADALTVESAVTGAGLGRSTARRHLPSAGYKIAATMSTVVIRVAIIL